MTALFRVYPLLYIKFQLFGLVNIVVNKKIIRKLSVLKQSIELNIIAPGSYRNL